MHTRRRVLGFGLVVSAAIAALLLAWPPDCEPATCKPPITWSPNRVVVAAAPGDVKTIQVTATINSPIRSTTIRLTPALAPYLAVTPQEVPPTPRGGQLTFSLTFTVPVGAPFQMIEGTLHLRASKKTLARPLPIALEIAWPRLVSGGVSVGYPPQWVPQAHQPTSDREFPWIALASQSGSRTVVLPEGGLAYDIDLDEISLTTTSITLAGRPAVREDYRRPDGFAYLARALFDPPLPTLPDFVVEFRQNVADPDAEALFEQVLESIAVE